MIPINNVADYSNFIKRNDIYLNESKLCEKGVFCSNDISKGEIIEYCPLLVFTSDDVNFLQHTNLYNYYALKSKVGIPAVLPLGFASIYNHSCPSNAEYRLDMDKKIMIITAVSSIEAHTEITINYNGNFDDESSIAFVQKNEIYEFSINLF